MMHELKFRHELKYIVSAAELLDFRTRLSGIMRPDPHTRNGKYLIRSIYFDDFYNSRVFANEEGNSPREKWRIRAYNCDRSFISLECKRKECGMILKTSCELLEEQYHSILNGTARMADGNTPLLNRFLYEQRVTLLQPVVIVQYIREPFIYPLGNVRVTFDCNIESSDDISAFFDPELPTRPCLSSGMHLLEVKYDEYIPDYIYHVVQMTNMRQETFSKYCLCRVFSRKGITAI